ncbi:phosphodiester glycosidase family protein [Desulfitobacterium metallireducens]|uniref:Exopolysaccharide biosynthesis protein n=1 Tax=Desulfitobacterium metallireducens DSM 15288 TaxID=871968 RepID=W0E6X2_9FIRM|nr:phosphodiester glycosidase family protein [Desulfitobacterium metallireducens]AHF06517.1 exopolysaccharide biosynthesis protein [Desulfitobacterium metallireducens DSM 15288]
MGTTGIPGSSRQTVQPRRLQGKPAGVYHYSRKKRRLRRIGAKSVTMIALLSLIFIGFRFAPFQPFEGLRNLWVTTAMTTLNHQYLATWFFSEDEIQKIMDSNQAANLGNSNPSAINTLGTNKDKGIDLVDISQKGFKGYLLKVKDPSRVKVAATQYLGTRGEKAEEIAKETGAVAVINGGAFSDPEGNGSGGNPLGILISNGKIIHKDNLNQYDLIGMDRNNKLILGHYTFAQIQKMGIRDAVSFDPFLVVNGKPAITQGDGGWGIAPRTAIGQARDGTILMLVIDGRQVGSVGATLKDVQDIMLKQGAYNVANLDGGASSVLYYQQQMVNSPSSKYGDRHLPSFFIVK